MDPGTFVVLDFPPGTGGREGEPTTIYSESLTGALYLDKPAEVDTYTRVWDDIIEKSLDEAASIAMIKAMAEEYES